MADSFPMVVACSDHGCGPIGASEYEVPQCAYCHGITHIARKYCALCSIRGELGDIILDPHKDWLP